MHGCPTQLPHILWWSTVCDTNNLAVSRLSPTVALGIAYYIQSCLWNLYAKADAGPKQAGDLQTFIVSEQVRAGMAVLDIQKDQTCI